MREWWEREKKKRRGRKSSELKGSVERGKKKLHVSKRREPAARYPDSCPKRVIKATRASRHLNRHDQPSRLYHTPANGFVFQNQDTVQVSKCLFLDFPICPDPALPGEPRLIGTNRVYSLFQEYTYIHKLADW